MFPASNEVREPIKQDKTETSVRDDLKKQQSDSPRPRGLPGAFSLKRPTGPSQQKLLRTGFLPPHQRNVLKLVKIVRKTLFKTVATGVKTFPMGREFSLSPEYTKDSGTGARGQGEVSDGGTVSQG